MVAMRVTIGNKTEAPSFRRLLFPPGVFSVYFSSRHAPGSDTTPSYASAAVTLSFFADTYRNILIAQAHIGEQ